MRTPHDTHAAPVLGLYFEPWGSTYYRLTLPVQAIGGAVAPFYDGATKAQVAAASCLVVSRMSAAPGGDLDALRTLLAEMRADGRRLVLDLDDDHRRIADPGRRAAMNLPALEMVAKSADAVVCTNDVLARRLRDWARDIRIMPNYIRAADWPDAPAAEDGPPWVVLAGSSTHAADWRMVAPALRRLRGRIRLRTVGFCPDYLEPDEHRPWGALEQYPHALAGADIGLCPLPRTPFNEAKTPIKAYEYALSGAAVVASPCQYGGLAPFGAYIVGDHANWYPILDHLVCHPEERRQGAASLRHYVTQTLDVSLHVETIRRVYAA